MEIRTPTDYVKFTVYRKPTHSNSYNHAFSNHSSKVKLGVISNMYLRAYKVCDSQYLDQEINKLAEIFQSLGYSKDFISKAHNKARKTFYNNEQKQFNKENYPLLVLPETNCNTKMLSSCLKDCNIVDVYRNTNTLAKSLKKKKNHSCGTQACIYTIPCSSCNRMYIGETIDLERRKKQHKDALRKGDENNALFYHRQNENHLINPNNIKKILNVGEVQKRRLIESLLIQNTENINIHRSNYHIDKITSSIIRKHSPFIKKITANVTQPP